MRPGLRIKEFWREIEAVRPDHRIHLYTDRGKSGRIAQLRDNRPAIGSDKLFEVNLAFGSIRKPDTQAELRQDVRFGYPDHDQSPQTKGAIRPNLPSAARDVQFFMSSA